jgi:hypothetical protein
MRPSSFNFYFPFTRPNPQFLSQADEPQEFIDTHAK